jgi:hypothetical protein
MESAGIMEAAGRFLSTRRVLILKVVSDMLTPEIPDLSLLDRYLLNHASAVLNILREAERSSADFKETSVTNLRNLIGPMSARLRLTAQMERQLTNAARRAILEGTCVESMLDASQICEPTSKRERKEVFEQIIRHLRDDAIPDNLR